MAVPAQTSVRNRLLLTLLPADFSLLQPQLEPVPLPLRTCLVAPNTPIQYVYFLEQGIASNIATLPQGRSIEVAITGWDGLSGASVLLGVDQTPHECFIQVPGNGLRICTGDLRRALAASMSLQQHLLRFVQALTIQTAQTALANGRCTVEERLARWLLMCHDRVDGDGLSATHEFLSVMLGVRRTGVTEMLRTFEDRGLISTRHRQVRVVDRVKLEAVAGDSYGVPEAEYSRLIGLPLGPAELPALRVCRSDR
jgi:CRP-like cAMP-binding protein